MHQSVAELWPFIHVQILNFVSNQYFENKLMEFDIILFMH